MQKQNKNTIDVQMLISVFNNAPIAMFLVDEQGKVNRANHLANEIALRPAENITGQQLGNVLRCIHSIDLDKKCNFTTHCESCKIRDYIVNTLKTGKNNHKIKIRLKQFINDKINESLFSVSTSLLEVNESKHVLVSIEKTSESFYGETTFQKDAERLSQVARHTTDWEYWLNPEGNYIYVSNSCYNISGYYAEEFVNDPDLLIKITREDFRNTVLNHYHKGNSSDEKPIFFEFPIITRHGEERWIEHHCHPVYDEQSTYLGKRGNNRDITVRKKMENVHNAVFDLHQKMDSTSIDQILKLGLDYGVDITQSKIGYLHFVNSDQKSISLQMWSTDTEPYCYVPEKIEHYPINEAGVWVDCIHQKKAVIHNDYDSLLHKKGLPEGHVAIIREMSVPVFEKDKIVAVIGVGNKPFDYNNQDIQFLKIIAENIWSIVRRKRAENELIEKHRELLEAQQIAHIGNWSHDLITNKIYWSEESFKIFGVEPQKVTIELVIQLIYPDDMSIFENATEYRTNGTSEFKHEFRIIRPNGEIRHIHNHWISTYNKNGKEIKRVGTHQDITEKKQLEMEGENLRALLFQQQRLKSISLLAGGVAHEINNPLTGIINYAQLINNRIQDENLKDFAQEIIYESERVSKIVTSLLSFARQDNEKYEATNVENIVDSALLMIGAIFRKEQIQLIKDISENLPSIVCSSQQIEQVLINLLTNAKYALCQKYADYHENKKIKISAKLFTKNKKEWIRVSVEDYGIGIPDKNKHLIFDPFFSTKPRDEGTGLGLSVSYGIVQKHNGELTVDSVPDESTCFNIDLPI